MIKVSLLGRTYCRGSIVLAACLFLLILSISMLIPVQLPAAEPTANAGSISDVQKAQIAADIAAKKPLRLVLREARTAGINIQNTVAAMLSAGADPAAVVNAAGAEGYKTNEAVSTVLAIEKGADNKVIQSVISAAIAVGVSQESLSTIAAEIGYKPAQIANAIVAAQNTSNAPVFGYSAPPQAQAQFSNPALAFTSTTPGAAGHGASGGGATLNGTTPAPTIIGGGGGGGTTQASPTRPRQSGI